MQRARKLFILYRPISKSKLRCSIWRLKFFQHFFPCYKNVTFILRFIPLCSFILACKNNILIILPNVLFQFYTVYHFYPVFSYFIFVYVILERVIEEKKKSTRGVTNCTHHNTHTHLFYSFAQGQKCNRNLSTINFFHSFRVQNREVTNTRSQTTRLVRIPRS